MTAAVRFSLMKVTHNVRKIERNGDLTEHHEGEWEEKGVGLGWPDNNMLQLHEPQGMSMWKCVVLVKTCGRSSQTQVFIVSREE